VYQKLKYSSIPLNKAEEELLRSFYPSFIRSVRKQSKPGQRAGKFLNVFLTLQFFTKPKPN
jgi:hypothetical protein